MEKPNQICQDNQACDLHPESKVCPDPRKQQPLTFPCTSSLHNSRHQTVLLISFLLITALALVTNPVSAGIDCFKCVSVNGDNPSCEDPFHNNYSVSLLESPCMGGRKNRSGLFPATACIKIAGIYMDNSETITVRGCALDSGSLTTDTEIIRMSHCGRFNYNERYVRGCVQSCDDADGCNGSSKPNFSLFIFTSIQITTVLCLQFWTKIF